MSDQTKAFVRPRILLIGANGQVGWELRRTLAGLGEVIAASIEGGYGPAVDLLDQGLLAKLVDESRPDAVVNAAASGLLLISHNPRSGLSEARARAK